jgi:hypothetical protein
LVGVAHRLRSDGVVATRCHHELNSTLVLYGNLPYSKCLNRLVVGPQRGVHPLGSPLRTFPSSNRMELRILVGGLGLQPRRADLTIPPRASSCSRQQCWRGPPAAPSMYVAVAQAPQQAQVTSNDKCLQAWHRPHRISSPERGTAYSLPPPVQSLRRYNHVGVSEHGPNHIPAGCCAMHGHRNVAT